MCTPDNDDATVFQQQNRIADFPTEGRNVLGGAPVLSSPLPGTDAEITLGLPNFSACDHVNDMQPLEENTALFRLGYQIDRVRWCRLRAPKTLLAGAQSHRLACTTSECSTGQYIAGREIR